MFNNYYKNKKVLVTGHTGFKGSWLVTWLEMLGAKVIGVALEPNTQPAHFQELKLGIQSEIVDIRDQTKIAKIIHKFKPEIIFHLAAQPLVRDSYTNPCYTFETNVIGTANLLFACRNLEYLKAVVVVTSDKCYDNKEWVWGYRETDPMGGFDPYSASKGCAELVTASFRNSYFNLDAFGKTHQTLIASARAGNVIGGGDWAKDRLIPDIMRAISANETVVIRNPNATRPWQHVLECLSGYLCLGEKLLEGQKEFASAWNFAPQSDGQIPVLQIVKQIQTLWPKMCYEIKSDPNNLHEAHLLKLDSSKANSILKWKSVWSFVDTIEITTNWYRQFYDEKRVATTDDINRYVADAKKNNLNWSGLT
ncbi:MAG: CDP-glucose 4,6-dehydratase [Gammaproteobacteria bacterium]|nr:CDP-glucose 4,6-dehydratase [Gammaproteobacteria bacterium]